MMNVENVCSDRIVIGDMKLDLFKIRHNAGGLQKINQKYLWEVIGYDSSLISFGFEEIRKDKFSLLISMNEENRYVAYHSKMYCFYQNYKYTIKSILGDKLSIFPEDKYTKQYLLSKDIDVKEIEINLDELISGFSTVWEERQGIGNFRFDTQPFVLLVDKGKIIETNLIDNVEK